MLKLMLAKASEAFRSTVVRALPMTLLFWLARRAAGGHTVLGDEAVPAVYTPQEMRGLRTLNEVPREES